MVWGSGSGSTVASTETPTRRTSMGCAVRGDLLERDFDGLGEAAEAAQALLVVGELGGGGELAVEEEVGDLFELAVGGEVEDVVAAVVEVVAVAAYGAEGGVAGGDSGEGYGFFWLEGVGGGFGGHGHPCEARAEAQCVTGLIQRAKAHC